MNALPTIIEGAHHDVPNLATGRGPARSDPRTPPLLKLLRETKIVIPNSKIRTTTHRPDWGMLGNDNYGDCDFAMWGHTLELMGAVENKPLIIPDQTVVQAYLKYTGGPDRGTVMLDSVNLRLKETWANFGQPVADAFAGLELGSKLMASVSASIYVVGAACLGVGLPLALQRTPYDWTKLPDAVTLQNDPNWWPGSWGGHAVPAFDFSPAGVKVVSWGRVVPVSWAMLRYIMDEGYAVSHPNWRNRKGNSPNGFTKKQVQDWIAAL